MRPTEALFWLQFCKILDSVAVLEPDLLPVKTDSVFRSLTLFHFDVFPFGAVTTIFSEHAVLRGLIKQCFSYYLVKNSTL